MFQLRNNYNNPTTPFSVLVKTKKKTVINRNALKIFETGFLRTFILYLSYAPSKYYENNCRENCYWNSNILAVVT